MQQNSRLLLSLCRTQKHDFEHSNYITLVFSYLDLSVLIHFLTRHALQTSKSSCCLLQTLLIFCEAPCLTMTKCFSWGLEILRAVKESLFTPQTRLLFINPGMVFTLCTAGWLFWLLFLPCSVLSPIYTKYLLVSLLPLSSIYAIECLCLRAAPCSVSTEELFFIRNDTAKQLSKQVLSLPFPQ